MSQRTLVLQLPPARGRDLKARLSSGDFDFRPAPYALFSVKGAGVVATLYESGKLVVQGANPELFVEQWLDGDSAPVKAKPEKRAPSRAEEALIGSDECGKGDYFGPLIVAAVRLEPGEGEKLTAGGVRDSKTVSDEQCLRLGAALRAHYPHAIARLDPRDYNATYKPGKLNDLLADLHVRAIRELAQPGIHVLVDQFANAKLMQGKLADLHIRLEQRTRAESEPAVAAASIIAREQFLTALRDLSEEFAVDLHKGAGPPVDHVANRFVAIHGREGLVNVAKLHFKNTQRIRDPR